MGKRGRAQADSGELDLGSTAQPPAPEYMKGPMGIKRRKRTPFSQRERLGHEAPGHSRQLRTRRLVQQLHQARTDHHRVRHPGHGLGRRRITDAEAYPNRHLDMGADAWEGLRHRIGVQMPGASDALQRHVVDIARRDAADFLHSPFGGGRRQQEDRIELGAVQQCRK